MSKLQDFIKCDDRERARALLGEIRIQEGEYLRTVAYFHGAGVDDSEDIVNEVFLELWEKWLDSRNSADCELDINYAWLNTVARNRALDATRRAERKVLRLDNAVLDRAVEGRDGEHIRKAHEALFELREELEGEDYSIFMFQMLNSDTAKAARAAGMQYSTFRSRWEKLVPKLKKRLELKGVTLSAVALLLGAKLFEGNSGIPAAAAQATAQAASSSKAVDASSGGNSIFHVLSGKVSAILLVSLIAGGIAGVFASEKLTGLFVDEALVNMRFEKDLSGWEPNLYNPDHGAWDVQWSPEFDGSCLLYVAGTPGVASISQRLRRDLEKGSLLFAEVQHENTNAAHVALRFDSEWLDKTDDAAIAPARILSYILEKDISEGTLVTLNCAVWPGEFNCTVKRFGLVKPDDIAAFENANSLSHEWGGDAKSFLNRELGLFAGDM
ncbi:MAG: sigma-70 family RNA polymerase sigma factor [Planctomycetota bacterium]|nr:sigma-70 family RNA polymerase sigma factor [Planctomycetota bacterium]